MTTQVSRKMTDLRERVRETLLKHFGDYWPHKHDLVAATDAIMALVQPVVTDEMADIIERDISEHDRRDCPRGDAQAALTAALPHAVTREQVIEELAVEAGDMMVAEIGGTNGGACLDLSEWLRSRKGGA